VVEELTADDIPTVEVEVEEIPVDDVPAAVEAPAAVAAKPPALEEIPVVPETPVKVKPASATHEPEPEPGVLKEFVSDLETSLGDTFVPSAPAKPAASKATPAAITPAAGKAAPAARTEPVIAAQDTAPVLGEFVADIEASLGEDFLQGTQVARPQPPAPVAKAAPRATLPPAAPVVVPPVVVPPIVAPPVVAPPVSAPAVSAAPAVTPGPIRPAAEAPRVNPPMAASAAASASFTSVVAPAAAATGSVAWQAPVVNVPKPQPPPIASSQAPAARAAGKASPFGDDAGVDLAEMFGELKQDLEADVASADEDPETHYNLGIAFREMGLLDEAIGELQKACQSFDHGKPFPQIMQTYTWLAQCFLEKGVPEAAVRWYDKALKVPGIDGETRVALHYELAAAYETAGDKASALHHFMDVYGNNIDYRDVAERIKALKS
jgi:hypothetical protein